MAESMLLNIENLKVDFRTADGMVNAVRGLSFELAEGESLGIVGESGSGKSQTVMAAFGLLDSNGQARGSVRYRGEEILNVDRKRINQILGNEAAFIFQDPMTSLNPHLRISTQMIEVLRHHRRMSRRDALKRSVELLDAVRIPNAAQRIHSYPHEFSGGMRQRVMIAMALLCEPKLLIADEPTTALDVTVQAEILDLLRELRERFNSALILITHDLGVVAGNCERVLVMQKGEQCETAAVDALFAQPQHAYTRELLAAVPRL
jgi:oligopeptide transport system ATP-binding protein